MASDTEEHDEKPARVGADLIIPIAAILLVIYYVTTILNSPWTAKVTAYLVGSLLVTTSLVYIAQSIIKIARKQAAFSLMDLVEPLSMVPTRTVLFVLTLGSIVLMPILGFTLTAILFLSLSMLLLTRGATPILIISLAVSLSFVWFVVFVLIFQRRFPLGWLDNEIKTIILPLLKSIGLG